MGTVVTGARTEFGGSLPVQNVQKLASNNLKYVPDQYIRPEIELEEITVDDSLQIPVIDMIKLESDHVGYQHEMEKLHHACKQWGFFQLINHGAIEEAEGIKVVMEEFFKLPLEEKMAYAQPPNSIEGYGQAFVMSDDQKLDWGDMLFLVSWQVSQRNMKLWPRNPISFRSTLEKYSTKLQQVSITLIRSMAENLGEDPEELSSLFQDGTQAMRMNYYPPCVEPTKVTGITPHSDSVGLTLLLQVNDVQGLQIKKDNKWLPIHFLPNSIVVKIGDVLVIMTNGEYKSIEHRAVVNYEKERLSIAAFHTPTSYMKIGPLLSLMKNGANYKTLEFEEYMTMIMNSKLDGKGMLDRLKLNYSLRPKI